jgi:hypothetical protein
VRASSTPTCARPIYREANIEDADFYLVDLRDAQYSPDQAEHFRRCRAILDARTA